MSSNKLFSSFKIVVAIKDVRLNFLEKLKPKPQPGLQGIRLGICVGLGIEFGLGIA